MTLDDCINLAQSHRAYWQRKSPQNRFPEPDLAAFRTAAASLGLVLPESWLRLLPILGDVVPCNFDGDNYCSIIGADRIVRDNSHRCRPDEVREPGEEFLSTRWFEFGGNDSGDSYTFDMNSPTMPQDARVVFWDHETGREIESWDSVVQFVAEMLGPVSELSKQEPRPGQP